MSWIHSFSKLFNKTTARSQSYLHVNSIPTVKFDSSLVTKSVREDLKRNLKLIDDLDKKQFDKVYEAAVSAISAGGNLQVLFTALMECEGMTKGRAGEIARSLNNKAMSRISRERQMALGITQAVWMYSNASCMVNARVPTEKEIQQDAAHRAANGTLYEISKGLFVGGKWIWPGTEDGCKCLSRVKLPFD